MEEEACNVSFVCGDVSMHGDVGNSMLMRLIHESEFELRSVPDSWMTWSDKAGQPCSLFSATMKTSCVQMDCFLPI